MIRIENLSKSFGSKHVLHNVNLTFESGRVYGIVGENGSGKTTLFRCMAGLEKFEGNVTAEGGNLKNQLGLLLTEPFLFPKITGREYIQLLCNARKKSVGDLSQKNVFDLPLDQYASTYSTGMKKKLALTAILLQENQFFILDEPFNGVDLASNIIITDIIRKLKALGKTVIVSSHIFSTLSETCDEIHLLKHKQFIQRVERTDFPKLEEAMKQVLVGNKLDQLDLK